jgi:UDP-N-acetylglucosamine 2-epimerase (non-hydrolysing)
MKIAPILRAMRDFEQLDGQLVHTGQHYDDSMSRVFFQELGIPRPAINLEIGSGSHGAQTGRIMVAFDQVIDDLRPDLVLVVGDVNSTIACAFVAQKRQIPVAHVEAGLRSFDRSMPEEMNRVLTDQLSDYLFTTEEGAAGNLTREGVPRERIHFVGNTMIDTLSSMLSTIDASTVLDEYSLRPPYGVATFHRPSNVDDPIRLRRLVDSLRTQAEMVPIVFPVHPRTRDQLNKQGLLDRLASHDGILLLEPLSYTRFLKLVKESAFVVTDSGGIQEESTWLGVPCLTQRANTERPITVEVGTNSLVGLDFDRTEFEISRILEGTYKEGRRPDLWDGRASLRICEVLLQQLPEA